MVLTIAVAAMEEATLMKVVVLAAGFRSQTMTVPAADTRSRIAAVPAAALEPWKELVEAVGQILNLWRGLVGTVQAPML